jgi:hypothetical protein
MPLFRRRPAIEFASPIGTLPCSEQGCSHETAITCAYRDRRGRVCAAAFCPDHWSMVGNVVYCRRHAGTIVAMGPGVDVGAMPELDNRGPSLVNHVADEIGPEVEKLLRATARDGETVKSESEVTVIFDHRRRRRWERAWKLIEPTGISLTVSLTVNEDEDDALIDVRVGATVIARGVPPWIARRRAGLGIGGQADADQRELFHRFFINHIAEAIALERAPDRGVKA